MAVLLTESFENGTVGNPVSDTNTSFTFYSGNAVFANTDVIHGNQSTFIAGGTNTNGTFVLGANKSIIYSSFYVTLHAAPTASNVFFSGWTTTTDPESQIFDMRFHLSGTVQVRNGYIGAGSNSAAFPIGEMMRIVCRWDAPAGIIEAQVFWGDDLHNAWGNYTTRAFASGITPPAPGIITQVRFLNPNGDTADRTFDYYIVDDENPPAPAVLPDTTPPSVPGLPSLESITETELTCSWPASTDDSDDQSDLTYNVYVNGVFNQTTAAGITEATITGLTADTPYSLTVSSEDIDGNESAQSDSLSVRTPATSDGGSGELMEVEYYWNGTMWIQ